MSAQAWKVYNNSKKQIGNGNLSLANTKFRLNLYTSASNAATLTLKVIGSLNNEVSEANGYSSSGKPVVTPIWTVGRSAKEYKFSFDPLSWSANGGNISNVKFAVVWLSGTSANNRYALCVSSLTSSQFNIAASNRLTVSPAAIGVLTLN